MYALCNYVVKMFKKFKKIIFSVYQLKIKSLYHVVVAWNCEVYLLVTSE